eukprot:TRINITY_DN2699_c0_g1_i1.p1 TRINITY_DN2699_c0_g1~~TRINITY_DN2699_c0_g1_i1.p1  ORF type:complete len:467 (-),score=67.81 TRINITY_DN2699_c0_g1_i1:37-1251(-)
MTTPQFCNSNHHPGLNCSEACTSAYTYPEEFPLADPSQNYTGRCCNDDNSCSNTNASQCDGWYQHGYSCDDTYECQIRHACYIGGQGCFNNYEEVCLVGGGSWFPGGYCNYEYFTEYVCFYGDACGKYSEQFCINELFGVIDKDLTTCNISGACCNVDDHCTDQIANEGYQCSFSNHFYAGENCSSISCAEVNPVGECCFYDTFCVAAYGGGQCNFASNDNLDLVFSEGTCPASGTCSGGSVSINDYEGDSGIPVNVNGVNVSTSSSSIIFPTVQLTNVDFELVDSQIVVSNNMDLFGTRLALDINSTLIVDGCINVHESELVIDLSGFDLEDDVSYDLVKFNCIDGDFDNVVVTGVNGQCYETSVSNLQASIFKTDCDTGSEEEGSFGVALVWCCLVWLSLLL